MSSYQYLKLQFIEIIGLSKDAVHIHIGLLVLVLTIFLWQKGKVTLVCIIPVLLVATGMECIDLYDDLSSVGYMRWGNSLHDIVNTLLWPVLIVIYFWIKKIGKSHQNGAS